MLRRLLCFEVVGNGGESRQTKSRPVFGFCVISTLAPRCTALHCTAHLTVQYIGTYCLTALHCLDCPNRGHARHSRSRRRNRNLCLRSRRLAATVYTSKLGCSHRVATVLPLDTLTQFSRPLALTAFYGTVL
jgi:hypothetical protein